MHEVELPLDPQRVRRAVKTAASKAGIATRVTDLPPIVVPLILQVRQAVDMGEQTQPRDIEVVVTEDGRFYINGSRCEQDALKDELSSYVVADFDRAARTVVVHADRDTEYGKVAAATASGPQAGAKWIARGCKFFKVVDEVSLLTTGATQTVAAYRRHG